MKSYEYDSSYLPPAPTVDIILATDILAELGVGEILDLEVTMMLNTGADISFIPKETVASLETNLGIQLPYKMQNVESFDGTPSLQKKYTLTLVSIGEGVNVSKTFDFIEISCQHGILGREIINLSNINLNGPELKWRYNA